MLLLPLDIVTIIQGVYNKHAAFHICIIIRQIMNGYHRGLHDIKRWE